MSNAATRISNRLAQATSPYLRQHASNPVDWFPWGAEAFARAKELDRPIFLSVGYSTCHWCHVMAHESFENPEIAGVLNEHFVSVKLDREERPDVDRVYMTYVQATTGGGGWPMSVWLTPEGTPFYAGTYFPPEDRWGRPGFASILRALARVWREDRGRAEQQGAHAIQMLQQFAGRSGAGEGEIGTTAIQRGFEYLAESFDEQWGGFGEAPKFPRPTSLQFLWRVHAQACDAGNREQADEARRMAEITLRRMIAGGIHDHLGGGFHRYSVDQFWHVPHFEKMLYDQAQIVMALLEAHQITGEPIFAAAARDTLNYVQRDLTSAEGGFYSAEDADSLRETGGAAHAEGAFYVWTAEEVRTALGPDDARLFAAHYGVEEAGNAPAGADPHGEFTGRNILIERRSRAETAAEFGLPLAEATEKLAAARAKLLALRERRPRPHRDEKILTAWNGLMIAACARAAQVLDDAAFASMATRAAEFLQREMWNAETGELRRSHSAGRADIAGFAEDYAFLVQGLLDLYEATFEIRWLQWAASLQAAQDRLFWDEVNGGYFASSGRDPNVLVRLKEDHDGAEPAASSVAVFNLMRLGRLLGDEVWLRRAERTLLAFGETWHRMPQTLPLMLAAMSDWLRSPRQVVLAGRTDANDFAALAREVRRRFLPGVVLLAADGGAGQAWLGERAAYLRDMRPIEGRAAAYVCENFTCRLPVTDPEQLGALLAAASTSPH